MFVLAGAACFILAFMEKSYISIVGVLILQIVNSIFQPLQLELKNKEITTDDRATMLSIYAMFMECIGISISISINLVIGYLTEISLNIAFIFGSVLCFIGMYIYIYGK